ncbi:hypothetical protein JZ751_009359 [Albula glossodonta]|uniref:Refilin B n=1 Tax=Albula glossodonta TaxID=121402 RepID=A0A8T2N239_9TELE|nr:hypothetical protein JZ751_009359 [Albula glossodonta]
MVGRLNLRQNVPSDDPLDITYKADRALDSPDSGLPPSPSPTSWLLSPIASEKGACSPVSEDDGSGLTHCLDRFPGFIRFPMVREWNWSLFPRQKYTSSVRYGSDRHFIHSVYLHPRTLALESCSQTILVLSNSTWRRFRTHLEFVPRQKPQRYLSTTIVFPKHARTVCATHLLHHGRKSAMHFLSSVELEAGERGAGL